MKKKYFLVVLFLILAIFLSGCGGVITPTNQAPIITSTPITTATVDVLYTYDVGATDPDGDTLTYSLTTSPAGMTITSTTGLINWTPTAAGDYDVMVEVSDNGSPIKSITQSFTIHVEEQQPGPINQPPTITSTAITTATVNQVYSYDVEATDPDGDTLTYFLVAPPAGMTINFLTGLITWTPTTSGNYNVTVEVSDGDSSDTQSFIITVTETPNQSSDCYESMIVSPVPFMGNNGEIFKLIDGSLWEVKYEYEYLYEYYPSVVICPSQGKLIIGGKSLNVELVASGEAVIESTIISDFNGLEYGNIYELANGQIWQQTEYYIWYWYWFYPEVLIWNDGGIYWMKVEGIDHPVMVKMIN